MLKNIDKPDVLRDVLNCLDRGVTIYDEQWVFLAGNDKARELLGLPKRLFSAGVGVAEQFEFLAGQNPADKDDILRLHAEIESTLKRRAEISAACRLDDRRSVSITARKITGGHVVMTVDQDDSLDRAGLDFARLDAIWAELDEAIILATRDRRVIEVNGALEAMFGYTREELAEIRPWDIAADPDDWERQLPDLEKKLEREGRYVVETKMRHKSGETIPIKIVAVPIYNARGEWVAKASIVRDLREQRALETRIRTQAVTLSQLSEAVIVTDMDGRIVDCNQAISDQFGYDIDELKGDTPQNMVADKKAWLKQFPKVNAIINRHGAWRGQIRVLHKNGDIRECEIAVAKIVDNDGRPFGYSGVLRDRTEELEQRRKALEWERQQKRLLHILDATSDFVGIFSADGSVLYLNGQARRMRGMRAADDLSDLSWDEWQPADSFKMLKNDIWPLAREQGVWQGELSFVCGDGNEVTMSVVILPYAADDKNRDLFAYIGRDISERLRHEGELKTAKEKAEMASQAKSQFLANMSHELRTPLNAIIGFSKIIEDQTLGEIKHRQYVEYAHDINVSANHLLGIINDILDLSKIEAGKFELKESNIDLCDVFSWCVSTMRTRIESARLEVTVEAADDLPDLRGDQRALRQIVLNLLSNAVKFTPEKGRIAIRAYMESEGILVEIADTGVGIRKENLQKVFRPFDQEDHLLNRPRTGTGLGLSITRSLVEAHGGKIWLESEEGRGTAAKILFPENRILKLS